jgi:glycosyltransferase involved in cell wall biosynthesis
MSTAINFIRRDPKDKLRILTFPTHERYETNLCKTGHDFYSVQYPGLKTWDHSVAVPKNYHLMPIGSFYPNSGYDLILAQSRYGQFELASKINESLKIPIISLEHTTLTPDLKPVLGQLARMVGDINVFISDYSASMWHSNGIDRNINVVEHCVDTEVFKPIDVEKTKNILTVANDFVKRDYCLNYSGWTRITQGLPIRLIGDTPGLSTAALSVDSLVSSYNKCSLYLNTTTLSPIPMSLLEAMACGCAVVSTATCAIPDFIEHGVDGLISNDEDKLREYCIELLDNEPKRIQLGMNARKKILERCSEERFIGDWNKIFAKTYEASL